MDKAAIKTFAINSRRKLMEDVEYRMSLVGISKDGIQESITDAEGIQTFNVGGVPLSIYNEDIKRRESLIKEIENKGFENVVEEVAYTWFNRIIAIRFMEVNDYLPTKTRVLSSETPGKIEPDIITEAFDLDLDYSEDDKKEIFKLKDENKLDELFRFLFIKQCNKLNEILPGLFEKTEDYMELLINISFINSEGVVRNLVDTISEEDFTNQVEIIGWLYQFYNSELKDDTYNNFKNFPKERIPSVTQLFTPDWIVKYMVENSIGRLWIEGHQKENLNLDYFLDESSQTESLEEYLNHLEYYYKKITLEDIKVLDPSMGSAHVLVYAIDVLMKIYESQGYSKKEAINSILKNNLFGLDIDNRAYQLSYFAIMMKARYYDRSIFRKKIKPFIYSIKESNEINVNIINLFDNSIQEDIKYIIKTFHDAKEYGSILNIRECDFDSIKDSLKQFIDESSSNLSYLNYQKDFELLEELVSQAKVMNQKYDVVITNPPYLGIKKYDQKLSKYIETNYSNYKADLYSVFIDKCIDFTKENGFISMITQQSWMYLTSFIELRKKLLELNLLNILHLGPNTFEELSGEVVQSCCFTIRNSRNNNYVPLIIDLKEFKSTKDKEESFLSKSFNYYNNLNQKQYFDFPDSIFMYKVSEENIGIYSNENLIYNKFDVKRGPSVKSTVKSIRNWFEVCKEDIAFEYDDLDVKKWHLCARNGSKIKWYLTVDEVMDSSILENISNFDSQNKLGVVWPDARFGSELISARIKNPVNVFESGNNLIEVDDIKDAYTLLALFNSYIYENMLSNLVNGQHFSPIYIKKLPYIQLNNELINNVKKILDNLEFIDSFLELSHNFKGFNFESFDNISDYYSEFSKIINKKLNIVKLIEEKINEDIEKITEIPNDTSDNTSRCRYIMCDVSENSFVRSFISYAVGCIFGRYSLDKEGLVSAGNQFDIDDYVIFNPDEDNIIPVLDTEYFDDDMVGRFIEFVKTCFGEDSLEENLAFIAKSLSDNDKTSKEIIREYFLKNFFDDHKKAYKNCPIYWQFSSGNQNGFNCLVYMHRYEPSLVADVRTGYLFETQNKILAEIEHCDSRINNSNVDYEKNKAEKEKNKLIKQLAETREYDEALAYIANQNIKIDLDDGVKANYAKFQNVEVSKEGQKIKKINLLK